MVVVCLIANLVVRVGYPLFDQKDKCPHVIHQTKCQGVATTCKRSHDDKKNDAPAESLRNRRIVL